MSKSFLTKDRFFDNKNYPRGFSRHGDFTIKEAQLLEKYGVAFNELNLLKRQPVTEEERLFIKMCQGSRKPQTEAEQVWYKYTSYIKRPKRFYTLSGSQLQIDTIEDYVDNDN
ncbi:MAG: DUF413 domain-containing protein [Pantoea sp. Brub]|nr:DUF413 domain-containing protein [Pantoea sp. Brub]